MVTKVFGRRSAGETVPIVVRVHRKTSGSREMPPTDVNGITATITSPTGGVVTTAYFEYVEEGVYLYNWDTSNLAKGTYKVDVAIRVTFSGSEINQTGVVILK